MAVKFSPKERKNFTKNQSQFIFDEDIIKDNQDPLSQVKIILPTIPAPSEDIKKVVIAGSFAGWVWVWLESMYTFSCRKQIF